MKEEKASAELNLNELLLPLCGPLHIVANRRQRGKFMSQEQTSEWVGKNCLLRHLVLKEVIGDLEGKKL